MGTSSWAYQWDVLETLRKLVLGSVVIFVSPGSTTQLFFFLIICQIALIGHIYVLPFKASLDNKLQGMALGVIVATTSFALYLVTLRGSGEDAEPDIPYLTEVILAMNIGVIAITACLFLMKAQKVCTLVPKMLKAAREAAKLKAAKGASEASDCNKKSDRKRLMRKSTLNAVNLLDHANDATDQDQNQAAAAMGATTAAVKVAASQKQPRLTVPATARNLTREQLAVQFKAADDDNSGFLGMIDMPLPCNFH
jgi:hypothetical protein